MSRSSDLAALAALLADDTRARFCLALLDGRAWTASELAAHATVAASTASEHLGRLIGGGLLVERRQGRHRYVQLAGPREAELIEGLVAHLEPRGQRPATLRTSRAAEALARGRTCYDHLAGRLGVALTDALTDRGLLDRTAGFALTTAGVEWLTGPLAVAPEDLRGRRPLAKECLDWTERRSHLAGLAGARLCERLLARGWVKRIGTQRAVTVTPEGTDALRLLLDLDPASLS
ncbi:helix-turn-helix domain-containing protein [Prauserella cavernicola]|uniref:Helix-turn-helix transcriptional regulator n=1 Tax=Prauserella cavernicola TaxID=2800127 RepID=A0A934QU56_9PSEU|nr:helix-turn-helix domain-containing protein [Prauserella cavernicola]MBK1785399.1 helix-turn-helix transcriptional regulator [Prauserella cavernicola]